MVTACITLAVVAVSSLAEVLHARRCHRVAHLAFGDNGHPRSWTRLAPLLRIAAMGALAWGLLTLVALTPKVTQDEKAATERHRRLLLLLDVSPSMQIADAGPNLDERRCMRAYDLMQSVMERVLLSQLRISVIAMYTAAREAVVDTIDPEVVNNILRDLPLEYVFKHGQTDLLAGLNAAAELARDWPPDNATIVILTDGDTIPAKGMPSMPRSVSDVLIVGVGNPVRGTYIDGHQSRQERRILRQVARRLKGTYHDGNQHHVPTTLLEELSQPLTAKRRHVFGPREQAILAVAVGSVCLAVLPLALELLGTYRIRPVRKKKHAAGEAKGVPA